MRRGEAVDLEEEESQLRRQSLQEEDSAGSYSRVRALFALVAVM